MVFIIRAHLPPPGRRCIATRQQQRDGPSGSLSSRHGWTKWKEQRFKVVRLPTMGREGGWQPLAWWSLYIGSGGGRGDVPPPHKSTTPFSPPSHPHKPLSSLSSLCALSSLCTLSSRVVDSHGACGVISPAQAAAAAQQQKNHEAPQPEHCQQASGHTEAANAPLALRPRYHGNAFNGDVASRLTVIIT